MIGPYLMACGLLVLAGAMKLVRPAGTVRALAQVFGLRRLLTAAVPVLAALELALGTAAVIWPRPALAGAVAVSYALFAGFIVTVRLRHGALSSCGCFGTPDTPATWLHAVGNVLLGLSAVVIAAQRPAGNLAMILSRQPLHGVPLVLASLVGMSLFVLAFSRLAQLTAVRHTLAVRVGESPS
jgi:hypothetical protein